MKNIAAFLLLLIFADVSIAQVSIPTASASELKTFLSGKTYFVLENRMMSEYNDMMKEVAEKIWTITPVEFISLKEFESKRNEKSSSFLMINQVWFDADRSNTLFDFLVLIAGGNYPSVNEMPFLCGVPLCFEGADEGVWTPKIPVAARFIQSHMLLVKDNPEINAKNAVDYYMNNREDIETKTLYLVKDDVESKLQNETAFRNIYPYPFQFVDELRIDELISSADSSALILHIISPVEEGQTDKCVKILINPGTARIYYYDMHDINGSKPPCLLESDVKKLVKKP